MKHVIVIDDSTKVGKGLLEIAKGLAKTYKSIMVETFVNFTKESKKPNLATKRAIKDAIEGNTEKVENIENLFEEI